MNRLVVAGIAITSILSIGCGQAKVASSGSIDNSSRELPTDLSDPTRNALGRLANCNGFIDDALDMSGLVNTFTDSLTGNTDLSQIRLQFTDLPDSFISGYDQKIEMRLWHEQTRGSIFNAPRATDFKIQHRQSGYYVSLSSGTYALTTSPSQATKFNELTSGLLTQIQTDIDYLSPGIYGSGVIEFLEGSTFILQNVTISYQAVSLALYPIDGGEAISSTEFLIPPFYADPSLYQYTHNSENLILLHPNYQLMNSRLTEDEFYLETNGFCSQML